MKKPIKIILRGVTIIIGILLIAVIIIFFNFWKATKLMTPAETSQLNDSVWCLKDRFVNAFIFKGQDSYLMVDAGLGKKNIKEALDKVGINPDQITTLLLTHTDGDHTGATDLFKNTVIYMHHDEEQMINGTMGKTIFSKTKWKYGPYKLLNSNDTMTLDGLKIKVLHTPGHTPGSSCYIIGKDYLVSGDNLVVKNGKYEHFTDKFNMNTQQQIESLKLLPDPATFKYILTGHNGIVKIQN